MDSEVPNKEKRNVVELRQVTTKPEVIDFDGENDTLDPQNWSPLYKWSIVVLISLISLMFNLGMMMCAPALPDILKEFHSESKVESTLLLMIWELGEVITPLVVAPLCEIYGRLPVYHVANILFLVFTIGAAESTSISSEFSFPMPPQRLTMQSPQVLIAMRFCIGLTVACTVLNPCIVGDMFPKERRGQALGTMGIIPFIAPILGPIAGGFITESKGWRWTAWLVVIMSGPLQVVFMILYRETYRVKILERKTAALNQGVAESLRHRYHLGKPRNVILRETCLRPLKLLITSRLVIMVGTCSALSASLVYVIVSSLSIIYDENYHFSQGLLGLSYLGLGIGMIAGVQLIGRLLDLYMRKKTADGEVQPEGRLTFLILGIGSVCLGVLAFGWTVRYHVHWIVPIIFTVLIGFGYVAASISAMSYILDVFGIHTAAAIGSISVLRNCSAATLPLAGPALASNLGYGWGYSVLSLIGLIALPVGCILICFGGRIRKSDRSVAEAQGEPQGSQE